MNGTMPGKPIIGCGIPPFSRIWIYNSRTNGSAAVVASMRMRSPGTTRVECSTKTFANFETRGSATKLLLLHNEYAQIISFLLGVYSPCNESPISYLPPMKQLLQNIKTGKSIVEDVPVPTPREGQALVRVSASLVSAGTERMVVEFAEKSL